MRRAFLIALTQLFQQNVFAFQEADLDHPFPDLHSAPPPQLLGSRTSRLRSEHRASSKDEDLAGSLHRTTYVSLPTRDNTSRESFIDDCTSLHTPSGSTRSLSMSNALEEIWESTSSLVHSYLTDILEDELDLLGESSDYYLEDAYSEEESDDLMGEVTLTSSTTWTDRGDESTLYTLWASSSTTYDTTFMVTTSSQVADATTALLRATSLGENPTIQGGTTTEQIELDPDQETLESTSLPDSTALASTPDLTEQATPAQIYNSTDSAASSALNSIDQELTEALSMTTTTSSDMQPTEVFDASSVGATELTSSAATTQDTSFWMQQTMPMSTHSSTGSDLITTLTELYTTDAATSPLNVHDDSTRPVDIGSSASQSATLSESIQATASSLMTENYDSSQSRSTSLSSGASNTHESVDIESTSSQSATLSEVVTATASSPMTEKYDSSQSISTSHSSGATISHEDPHTSTKADEAGQSTHREPSSEATSIPLTTSHTADLNFAGVTTQDFTTASMTTFVPDPSTQSNRDDERTTSDSQGSTRLSTNEGTGIGGTASGSQSTSDKTASLETSESSSSSTFGTADSSEVITINSRTTTSSEDRSDRVTTGRFEPSTSTSELSEMFTDPSILSTSLINDVSTEHVEGSSPSSTTSYTANATEIDEATYTSNGMSGSTSSWDRTFLSLGTDYSTSMFSSYSSEGETHKNNITTLKVEEFPSLKWIPQRREKLSTALEVLVSEPDMRILGGAVASNERYPSLQKLGLSIFAPVDSAFDSLPLDIRGMTHSAMLKTKKTPRDAHEEEFVTLRNLRRGDGVKRKLASANRWVVPPNRPVDCEAGECMRTHYQALWAGELEYDRRYGKNEKNVLDDFEKLVMYHVVRKMVPPGLIEARGKMELKTEMIGVTGSHLTIHLEIIQDAMGRSHLMINDEVEVIEIVHCRNGFVYKTNRPLFPPFTATEITLVDFIRTDPRYRKLRYLLDGAPAFSEWARAGPITMMLVPDNAWKMEGVKIPQCFFKALVRPENSGILLKLLKWVTVPGLWTSEDIQASDWLPNGAAPSLSVTNIRLEDFQRIREIRAKDLDKANNTFEGVAQPFMIEAVNIEGRSDVGRTVTLVEGKEVSTWDLRFYNGYGHEMAEIPIRPDLDLRGILWDCLDSLCDQCPIVTKYVLRYLDHGGLLPDISNPKAYIVPPGIRPQWVCQSAPSWFPPGWDRQEWKKYLNAAKSGSHKTAQNIAYSGWKRSAGRNQELLDKYEEAEVHLSKLWRLYSDPGSFVLGHKEDPSKLLGWLKNKRSLEYMPKICAPTSPRKPGYYLEEDLDEEAEAWYGPREQFQHRLEREQQRKFGMEDLKVVSQWI